jgi:hypothetical protein
VSSTRSLNDSDDSMYDELGHVKVAVAAAAAGITFNFYHSNVGMTRVMTLESNAQYFLKGYYQAPGTKMIPKPHANEVVVFEDFFVMGLHMPSHPMLAKIL